MPGRTRSRTVSVLAFSFLLACLPLAADAQVRLDLPAQPLAQALTTLGSLANINIYFDAPTVDGIQAPALKAEISADDALGRLLAGTRLRAVRVDDNTFRVVAETAQKRAQGSRDTNTGSTSAPAGVHLAYAGAGAEPATAAVESRSSSGAGASGSAYSKDNLSEVVVSAQKRDERLQDVPVPVTAVSASALVDANQLRLQDYYSSVPGLDLTLDNRGSPVISIRGITTSFYTSGSTPTVGITIDDVPYETSGPSTFSPIPDVDPNELARVEVLRGPQGTLYGSSSIGGLIKYVTIDPSTAGVSGHAEAGLSGVQNGDKLGYNVSAGVNIPLSDTVALRASGFTHEDPGYIDNVQTGQHDVNERKVYGGRVSALWQPSQNLSLKLSALLQDSKAYGPSQIDVATPGFTLPPLGDLQQSNLINSGGYDRKIQAYSANLNAQIGAVKLTSVTGYNVSKSSDSFDFTWAFGPYTQTQFGVTGTPFVEDNTAHKFSQEIRASMPLGSMVDWLVGAFYTHEDTKPVGGYIAVDPATGTQVGRWLDQRSTETYTEYAAFTDFTVHVTDQFDVQLGGRESENRTTNASTLAGPYVPFFLGTPSPDINPEVASKDKAFTYLVTPKYTFSPDFMAYARLASGFRPGGPNSAINARLGQPASFAPDTTRNYELGVKGDVLDHVLTFDASVYYIDWNHIQITIYDPGTSVSYGANGSHAKSQGEEFSVQSRPLPGLNVGAWVTWSNAVLTQPFPAAPAASGLPNAASGDRLPYSSRFSGHLSFEQEFPLVGSLSGFFAGSVSYVGDRKGEFTNAPPRQDLPAYVTTDLRTGARLDDWTANLFVTNIADRRGLLQGGIGFFPPYAFDVIQPRTIGLTVSRKF
ncbi:MAG: TonB-dependent receptor [Gammaproteobacteria bacterium]|nr:TonB-dependent receptor [Gammaproteobacteria bacterium]